MKQEDIIKQDNKKAGKTFVFIMLACAVMGGICGFCSVFFLDNIEGIIEFASSYAEENIFSINIILSAIMIILTAIITICILLHIKKGRKNIEALIAKDMEEELGRIETSFSIDLWITNGLIILNLLYFSIVTVMDKRFCIEKDMLIILMPSAILLISILAVVILQQKIIDIIRIMNPEKKGSVYDVHFVKKWEQSSDEAELMVSYRAAYKAFRVVNVMCLILWMIFIIMGITIDIGIFPSVAVILIWAVLVSVYSYYEIKFSK